MGDIVRSPGAPGDLRTRSTLRTTLDRRGIPHAALSLARRRADSAGEREAQMERLATLHRLVTLQDDLARAQELSELKETLSSTAAGAAAMQ